MQRPPARVFAPHLGRSDLGVTGSPLFRFVVIGSNPLMRARARVAVQNTGLSAHVALGVFSLSQMQLFWGPISLDSPPPR